MNKMDKLKIKSQRKTCTVLQFHLCKHLKVVKLSSVFFRGCNVCSKSIKESRRMINRNSRISVACEVEKGLFISH